jgi:hypothetical protein
VALEALLADGLSKDPARRPPAAEFLERLRGLGAGRPRTALASARPSTGLHWALALTAAIVVGGIALLRLQPALAPMPEPPRAVPSAAPNGSTAAPTLRVSRQADAIVLLNAGPQPLADLRVTLEGEGAGPFVATAPGRLEPGEELMLSLDTFEPTPPPGWRPQRVGVTRADGSAETLTLAE